MARVLFICKKRQLTGDDADSLASPNKHCYSISTGLLNSARFNVDMLNANGHEAKIIEVIDNNCIDREVTKYKPTHAIIEAYWVVPEKFHILQKLHPTVKWIVRNHSETPFLAMDGCAMDWSLKYIRHKNVYIAPNSYRGYKDMVAVVTAAYGHRVAQSKVMLLPNYYTYDNKKPKPLGRLGPVINIGCFGAIRPLKNQLIQAIAAIDFARKHGYRLQFHINVGRNEDATNSVLKNIRGTFANLSSKDYALVEHHWLTHDRFLCLVEDMDIGLQASFTESFNIVTADFVSKGIPIVVSPEVFWMPKHFQCNPTDSRDIVESMERVLFGWNLFRKSSWALCALNKYNSESEKIWLGYL